MISPHITMRSIQKPRFFFRKKTNRAHLEVQVMAFHPRIPGHVYLRIDEGDFRGNSLEHDFPLDGYYIHYIYIYLENIWLGTYNIIYGKYMENIWNMWNIQYNIIYGKYMEYME